jgi:hypothetical protein
MANAADVRQTRVIDTPGEDIFAYISEHQKVLPKCR